MIEPDEVSQDNLPEGSDIKKPDNRIISSCVGISKKLNPSNPSSF